MKYYEVTLQGAEGSKPSPKRSTKHVMAPGIKAVLRHFGTPVCKVRSIGTDLPQDRQPDFIIEGAMLFSPGDCPHGA